MTMEARMKWIDNNTVELGDTRFFVTYDPQEFLKMESTEKAFVVAKAMPMISQYLEMTSSIEVRKIFEMGILHGGSTALYYKLFQPEKLVAIERTSSPAIALDQFIRGSEL